MAPSSDKSGRGPGRGRASGRGGRGDGRGRGNTRRGRPFNGSDADSIFRLWRSLNTTGRARLMECILELGVPNENHRDTPPVERPEPGGIAQEPQSPKKPPKQRVWERDILKDIPQVQEFAKKSSKDRGLDQETSSRISVATGAIKRGEEADLSPEDILTDIIASWDSKEDLKILFTLASDSEDDEELVMKGASEEVPPPHIQPEESGDSAAPSGKPVGISDVDDLINGQMDIDDAVTAMSSAAGVGGTIVRQPGDAAQVVAPGGASSLVATSNRIIRSGFPEKKNSWADECDTTDDDSPPKGGRRKREKKKRKRDKNVLPGNLKEPPKGDPDPKAPPKKGGPKA